MFIPPYNPRSWPITGLSCLKNKQKIFLIMFPIELAIFSWLCYWLVIHSLLSWGSSSLPFGFCPIQGPTNWSHLDERGNGCGGLQAAATLTVHLGGVLETRQNMRNMGNMISKWVWTVWTKHWGTNGPAEIRPHRFGGEGVLIGAQTATLNTQWHLLI